MKLACTGFVSEQAGSVAAANALLLRELLEGGFEIDFFSKPSFVDPRPVVGDHSRFRFVPVVNHRSDGFRRKVERVPVMGALAGRNDAACYNRMLVGRIRAGHRLRQYDAVLWMGDYAHGAVPGIPSISFAQGAPGTDARSILRRRAEIRKLAGIRPALKWELLARLRLSRLGLPKFHHSDHFIVGSSVSRERLATTYRLPRARIATLPYPIDLDLFKPGSEKQKGESKNGALRVLWLGRIVPRKRLDLFLDGAALAITEGLDVQLTIVGGIGFIKGYQNLIRAFPFPERLHWIEHLPRHEVPALLRAHDVLAQPSEEEDFGSSAAEAQACGLPVIVGQSNGNADYLCTRDLRLQDDHPASLAAALRYMAQSRLDDGRDAALSRNFAEKTFNVEAVGQRLGKILRDGSTTGSKTACTDLSPGRPLLNRRHASQTASVAFIVPTLKRVDFLNKCLTSLARQTVPPSIILVGLRLDDKESLAAVEGFTGRCAVRAVEAKGVGVIGSMSSCLKEAKEQYIALVDDDVELPSQWLETMLAHLAQHPDVLAAAGRDFLQDHPEMRRTEKRVMDVGTVHWYGRMTGNHHRGGGPARCVDILRGSNCLFWGDFLREVGFEQRLRGQGAQVNWELALAFQAMQRKKRFFYDPAVEVIHHVAPRHDRDSLHRGKFDAIGTNDSAFNETFVTIHHAHGWRRLMTLIYQGLVGSSLAPGILHVWLQLIHARTHTITRLTATIQGRLSAICCAFQLPPIKDAK